MHSDKFSGVAFNKNQSIKSQLLHNANLHYLATMVSFKYEL